MAHCGLAHSRLSNFFKGAMVVESNILERKFGLCIFLVVLFKLFPPGFWHCSRWMNATKHSLDWCEGLPAVDVGEVFEPHRAAMIIICGF